MHSNEYAVGWYPAQLSRMMIMMQWYPKQHWEQSYEGWKGARESHYAPLGYDSRNPRVLAPKEVDKEETDDPFNDFPDDNETRKIEEQVAKLELKQSSNLICNSIPFPLKLKDKKKRDNAKFVSFLNLFKSLNMNLPLIELIDKIIK